MVGVGAAQFSTTFGRAALGAGALAGGGRSTCQATALIRHHPDRLARFGLTVQSIQCGRIPCLQVCAKSSCFRHRGT